MKMQVGGYIPSLVRDKTTKKKNAVCSAERCRTAAGLRGKQCKKMDESDFLFLCHLIYFSLMGTSPIPYGRCCIVLLSQSIKHWE